MAMNVLIFASGRRKHHLLSYRLSAVLLNISDAFKTASAMCCINFYVCKIKFIGNWVSNQSRGLRGTRHRVLASD